MKRILIIILSMMFLTYAQAQFSHKSRGIKSFKKTKGKRKFHKSKSKKQKLVKSYRFRINAYKLIPFYGARHKPLHSRKILLIKKKRIAICGIKTRIPPKPAKIPSVNRLRYHVSARFELTKSVKLPKPASIISEGTLDQA